jgi:hypothetical protein
MKLNVITETGETIDLSQEAMVHRNRDAEYWRGFCAAAGLAQSLPPQQIARMLKHGEKRLKEAQE